MRPEPRRGPIPFFSALGGALLLLGVLLAAGPEETFAALPFALIVVALVFRRYPGERLIARLAERFRPRRRRPASSPAPRRAATLPPRPVLAALLAVRPLRGPPRPVRHSL